MESAAGIDGKRPAGEAVRAEILTRLGRLAGRDPGVRFGQLVAFLGDVAAGRCGRELGDVEDAEFLDALRAFQASQTSTLADADSSARPDRSVTGPAAVR